MASLPAASASARLPLFARALAAAGIVAALDLASKWAILAWVMNPPRVIPVLPSFNLVLGFNRGVSFGLLSDLGSAGPTIVSAMTAAIVGLLTVWLWRARLRSELVALSLIIGGASGNLIDRLHDGAVTDFLDFYVGRYHWPAFNGADTAITLGVICLLFSGLRPARNST
jgi:signal peptidase II